MTWFPEQKLSWLEWFMVQVLKTGLIPNHVAIIMDGNRRFARKHHMVLNSGHASGFEKLVNTLRWCKEFGIRELTVYAFSIENFKRSKEEVDGLLNLAREKFEILWKDREKLTSEGIKVRAFGDLKRMPNDIQKCIAQVLLYTQNNNKFYINLCVAYTGREEIFQSVKLAVEGTSTGLIQPQDINESVLQKCLYSGDSLEPDLIIRTSGETRLSDFLLWQSSYAVLAFVDVLWPEFTIWNLIYAIFYYQRHVEQAKKLRDSYRNEKLKKQLENKDIELFLKSVSNNRFQMLNDSIN